MRTGDSKPGISAAFVVGVEEAQGGLRPPARHAAADAASTATAIGLPEDRRVLLLNATGTKTTIESRLRRWASTLSPDDVPMIFISAYGFMAGGVNYLVAHDTQPDDPVATAIPVSSLVDAILPAGRAVFFLDLRPLPHFPDGTADVSSSVFEEMFGDSESMLAFVSRGDGEESLVSDSLGHGLWSYLVCEAFAGGAESALDGRQRLTPRSLQRYLSDELPRLLRGGFERPKVQTPLLVGRPADGWVLADLGPTVRTRRAATGLIGQQLERVVLWSESRMRVKDLAGFEKTHTVPDRVRPATERFAAAIARQDLVADLDATFEAIREHLGYRRKDIVLTAPADGAGGLRTPDFDYLASVTLADDDPASVVFRREVTHLRSADVLRRSAFQAAFGSGFQALAFEYSRPLDVEMLVDHLEEDPPAGTSVRYAADGSWCELDVSGFPGSIRVETNRLVIQGRRPDGPNSLWAAFEAFRDLFNRATEAKSLPPAGQ